MRDGQPRVVIIGAGFGGLNAAKELAGTGVEVLLIDRNNYHRFQPLLYEVAMAGLESDEVAQNVRGLFRGYDNVRFRLGTVKDVDRPQQKLVMREGEPIDYDYLIVAAGSVTAHFGVEGAREHTFPLKSLPDAVNLRNHILRRFEHYDRQPDNSSEGLLNFVIVGGGPTGVEMAGAMTELINILDGDFPERNVQQARVFLVEMLPDVLPTYDERLRRYTRQALEDRGVTVMTETVVERVTEDTVFFEDKEPIPTDTLVWAAGVKPHPLAESLDSEQARDGRLIVRKDLRLPEDSLVFVIGDMSGAVDESNEPYPQLAPVAIQQGRHAARQILRLLDRKETEPFSFTDRGKMATIGRNAAVAELPNNLHLTGFIAWVAWVVIHIAQLVGFRNRLNVFVNWIYNYLTYDRNARLIIDMVPIPEETTMDAEEVTRRVSEEVEHFQHEEN